MRQQQLQPQSNDLDPMYASLRRTARFVWDNLVEVVQISLAWFLAVLPIVTIGPATVGAYRAVLSLREDDVDGIDRGAVLEAVREGFVHATLLSFVPLVLLVSAANYALAYLASGAVTAGLLGLGCLYAGLYAGLVSMPTLLGLAAGKPVLAAFADGYRWTARHAVGAVALGVVTVVLFVVSSVLTVAVAVLFAGVAFALHVEFVASVSAPTEATPITTEAEVTDA
ncbi:YesL family protein [Halopiger thermotolerans]